MSSPLVRSRGPRAALLACGFVLVCLNAPATHAQEFVTIAATGEPAETTYVRLAFFPRASLRMAKETLLAHLDAIKRAGGTDIAVDIWDMGTVPYANSVIAFSDTSVAAADPLATITKRCFETGLRCWLWPSAGFEVWRTPLAAPIDPGPFLRSRPEWTAVNRDGIAGFPDSTSGVRRYTLNPVLRDAHQYLMKTFDEAIGRYPVAGLLLDGIEFPSMDYSFDGSSNEMFMKQYDPIDPRGLTPADTVAWANWYSMRNDNCRTFTNGMRRNLNKQGAGPTVAVVVRPSTERREHIQDWPQWNKRGSISWILVRPSAQTLASLRTALDSTAHELAASTPNTRHAPGLGLVLDGTQSDVALREQIATLGASGGRILAVSEAAVVAAPARWQALWSGLAVERNSPANYARPATDVPVPRSQRRASKRATTKHRTTKQHHTTKKSAK